MNILTIDLEDWFHILDYPPIASVRSWENFESRIGKNTDRILELLDSMNIRATFFSLGWVAGKYPDLIKKIAARHEIGCHSMFHELVYTHTEEYIRSDIERNRDLLQQLTGKKVNAYRAPGFSFTPQTKWLVRILAQCGIDYDCSLFPVKRNHGGYERFPHAQPCIVTWEGFSVKEMPLNYAPVAGRKIVFSGGGYFRLLPYVLIRSMMKREYVMTYFHPRDFDPDQPVLHELPLKRKLMSYTGLKNSFGKFNRLMKDHKFTTVDEAGKAIDWAKVPEVRLENY